MRSNARIHIPDLQSVMTLTRPFTATLSGAAEPILRPNNRNRRRWAQRLHDIGSHHRRAKRTLVGADQGRKPLEAAERFPTVVGRARVLRHPELVT